MSSSISIFSDAVVGSSAILAHPSFFLILSYAAARYSPSARDVEEEERERRAGAGSWMGEWAIAMEFF
jgi:hypothetical protein